MHLLQLYCKYDLPWCESLYMNEKKKNNVSPYEERLYVLFQQQ